MKYLVLIMLLVMMLAGKIYFDKFFSCLQSVFLTIKRIVFASVQIYKSNIHTLFANKTNLFHVNPLIVVLTIIVTLTMSLCQVNNSFAVDEWTTASPAGTDLVSSIDDTSQENNTALDRIFPYLQGGCDIEYLTSATLTVKAGMTVCSNAAGTTRKLRTNTSDVTVTWSMLDTGSEPTSTWCYLYSVGDADTATYTVKISTDATSPSGITYFKKLGKFYNDSSSNITQVSDNNAKIGIATGTCVNGATIPLPTGGVESESFWMVSINSITDWDGGGDYQATFSCSANSSRVATITQTGSQYPATGTVNYIIINLTDCN